MRAAHTMTVKPQTRQQGPPLVGSLPQDRQFTRRDLNIDEDINEDLNMSYDFLSLPPRQQQQGAGGRSSSNPLDNLSLSGSSNSSSTVVRPAKAEPRVNDALKSIPTSTLETDRGFTGKIRSTLIASRINAARSRQQDPLLQPRPSSGAPQHAQEHTAVENRTAHAPQNATDPSAAFPLIDMTGDNDPDSDKLNDYIDGILPSPPASPPRELDPTKLYALYDFNGPDPSHIELLKDDSVELLNDTDSYWWLVRRLCDGQVGFAPAEVLETYEERLARLNCWKNEVLERGKNNALLTHADVKLFEYNPSDKNLHSIIRLSADDLQRVRSKSDPRAGRHVRNARSLPLVRRKSSLKRQKNPVKKSVTFAGSLPNLPEEVPKKVAVVSQQQQQQQQTPAEEEKMPQLVVPKRASKTNFLIHDLDAYDRKYGEGKDAPPSPPFTSAAASGAASIGSYSPSTISEYDSEQDSLSQDVGEVDRVLSQSQMQQPQQQPQQQQCQQQPQRTASVPHRSFSESRAEFLRGKQKKRVELHPTRNNSLRGGEAQVSRSIRLLDDLIQNSPEFNSEREAANGSYFADANDVLEQYSADNDEEDEDGDEATYSAYKTTQKVQSFDSTISSESFSTTMSPEMREEYKKTMSTETADSFYSTNSALARTPTCDPETPVADTPVNDRVRPAPPSDSKLVAAGLHPVTTEIFNPLIDHIEELEKMLNDMSVHSASF